VTGLVGCVGSGVFRTGSKVRPRPSGAPPGLTSSAPRSQTGPRPSGAPSVQSLNCPLVLPGLQRPVPGRGWGQSPRPWGRSGAGRRCRLGTLSDLVADRATPTNDPAGAL